MKNLLFSFLLCLMVSSAALAQTERNDYQKLDYINVSQDHVDEFLSFAKSDLKTSYNSLVESGKLKSWKMYKVQYPGGTKSNYNFVSVSTAESLDKFGNDFSKIATAEIIPAAMGDNGNKDFRSLCETIKSELWKVENDIPEAETPDRPSQYMTMDYMEVNPGKSFDYLMLEDEVAKPLHIERINRNRMQDWEVYSLIIPGGRNYGYNFATGNYFTDLEHIEFGFTNELIKKTMGENSNIPELFNTIYDTRDLVRRELWQLVSYAD